MALAADESGGGDGGGLAVNVSGGYGAVEVLSRCGVAATERCGLRL